MRRPKSFLVAATAALVLLVPVSTATAGPMEDFCERSPRDGKARWYPILCE